MPASRSAVVLTALSLLGCATTMGSGIESAGLARAPYYTGDGVLPATAVVAHLPITYQRGVVGPPGVEPSDGEGSAMARLLMALNAYLDRLGLSSAVSLEGLRGRGPDVRFGCVPPGGLLCDPSGGPWERWGRRIHWLDVTRPSQAWIEGTGRALAAAGASHVLVLTVELSEYWPREMTPVPLLELGSGHSQSLSWYTDPEMPVYVIQLTGALLDGDGRALRIGAEGLMARPSGLGMTLLGAQRLIREGDVERLLTAHREDLPGDPLVWEVAVRTLVTQLLDASGRNH
jgi:hypothetical protein